MEEVRSKQHRLRASDSKAWFGAAFAVWLLCSALAALTFFLIRRSTGGMFVYPLDDTYIHLTVAKMLALHGVWGIRPDTFASASSAPGWTLLLTAADRLFGLHLYTPLVLNALFALAAIWMACATVRLCAPESPAWIGALITVAAMAFAPLTGMWIMGMEHVAQIFTVLLLLWAGTRLVLRPADSGALIATCFAAMLTSFIRYESVFVVGAVVALLLLRKRFADGLLVALSGAVPVILFGLYFHAKSGFFLPYSVIIKASQGHHTPVPLLRALFGFSPLTGALLPLLIYLVAVRVALRRTWDSGTTYGAMVIFVVVAHLLVARAGWLLRYEAYAVAALVLAVGILIWRSLFESEPAQQRPAFALGQSRTVWAITLVSLLFSATVMLRRFWSGQKLTVIASVDRLDEHIQMAQFLSRFYDNSTVVLDDIGAVSYFTHVHILDLAGLGSVEPVLPVSKGGEFTAADLKAWAAREGASIAVLQPGYEETRSRIPKDWLLVQTWKQPRNVVFQDLFTSFYAVRPEEVSRLCASLTSFNLIPADVVVYNACSVSAPQLRPRG